MPSVLTLGTTATRRGYTGGLKPRQRQHRRRRQCRCRCSTRYTAAGVGGPRRAVRPDDAQDERGCRLAQGGSPLKLASNPLPLSTGPTLRCVPLHPGNAWPRCRCAGADVRPQTWQHLREVGPTVMQSRRLLKHMHLEDMRLLSVFRALVCVAADDRAARMEALMWRFVSEYLMAHPHTGSSGGSTTTPTSIADLLQMSPCDVGAWAAANNDGLTAWGRQYASKIMHQRRRQRQKQLKDERRAAAQKAAAARGRVCECACPTWSTELTPPTRLDTGPPVWHRTQAGAARPS